MKRIEYNPVPKFLMTWDKQQFGHDLLDTVNLRQLHEKLMNGSKFSFWIKDRIERYGFIENKDYVVIRKITKRDIINNLATTSVEYYGTLTMAKELAMLENNAIGKSARKYFIKCEEELWKLAQTDKQIYRMRTQPLTRLGFEQISLEDRLIQQSTFHKIMSGFNLAEHASKNSYIRIKMCKAVNLVLNGMTSYRFRKLTGVRGKTRDWLPIANQYAIYRVEHDLLEMCVRNQFQLTFEQLAESYLEFARLYKPLVEKIFGIADLRDELINYVLRVLETVRQQLEDDTITPYQYTLEQIKKLQLDREEVLQQLTNLMNKRLSEVA